jgi:Flp pilus assembly pilin Flp
VLRFRAAVRRGDCGQASEYAVLLALVAAGLLVALLLFGTSVGRTYGRVANSVGNPGQIQETGAVSGGGGASQPAGGGGATSAQTGPGKGDKDEKEKKKDGCRGDGDRTGGDNRGGCGDGRGR